MIEEDEMSDLAAPVDVPATLIDSIRKRPGMYFGSKSLTAFCHFLGGYQMACGFHQIESDRLGLEIPRDFHDWVAYRTHFQESTTGWCNMIVATSKSEEEAFDRFFELLEERLARVPRLIAEYFEPVDSSMEPPDRIQVVKFTDDPGFFTLHQNENWGSRFRPYLSWIWARSGGKWVIHDEAAYRELLRESVEWERKLEESLDDGDVARPPST